LPLFSYPGDFKKTNIMKKRRAILVHVKSEESKINHIFKSRRRLIEINKQFTR
ncbi:hypothetical protein V2W45_1254242, partial [Cenococcum geophilum]